MGYDCRRTTGFNLVQQVLFNSGEDDATTYVYHNNSRGTCFYWDSDAIHLQGLRNLIKFNAVVVNLSCSNDSLITEA